MRRLTALLVLTAALSLAMGGIAFATADVTIGDDGLDPESVEARVREDIVWTNASDKDVSLVGKSPSWTSGPIQPGATFSIKITEKGTYEYASEDGSLEGEIVVGGGGGGNTEPEDEGDDPVKKTEKDPKGGDGTSTDRNEDESLPRTGIDVAVPAALSLLLIALGVGLLVTTVPMLRLRA